MRGSTSKLVLVAGFLAVAALAVGLVQLTHSATPAGSRAPSSPGATTTPAAAAPAAGSPASVPAAIAAPSAAPAATPSRGPSVAARQPELAPAIGGFSRDLKRDANGHLVPIISLQELRTQIARTEAPMRECIARSGQRATGKATLSFTVAAKAGTLVVEATGVQDEDTLAAYPELLECMHRTANALVLDGRPIPELGTPIYVRRHVQLENGALAENSFSDFSYNP